MITLRRLSRLSLTKCTFNQEMWNILLKLVESSQSLLEMDLSGNFFDDENIPIMIAMIRKTKSIRRMTKFN